MDPKLVSEECRHCKKCKQPDSAENMVGCDSCDTWEHYSCADVTDSIADPNRSWKCGCCREKANPERNDEANSEESATQSGISVTSTSVSKKSQSLHLSLELLEQQRKLKLGK